MVLLVQVYKQGCHFLIVDRTCGHGGVDRLPGRMKINNTLYFQYLIHMISLITFGIQLIRNISHGRAMMMMMMLTDAAPRTILPSLTTATPGLGHEGKTTAAA